MNKKIKILISGGGTGGHTFPAIAIAKEIKKKVPNAEILFIGANGKIEMQKVPEAGFKIEGLNIEGFNRNNFIANLKLPFKLLLSLLKVRKIIKNFKPDFAIGTGGFASGPALFIASKMKIPIFIQEQNSLPGKTNTFLSKRAKAVFTAYPNMHNFFQKKTPLFFLGNPIRENLVSNLIDSNTAKERLGLNKNKLTILSLGGSLGAKILNGAWEKYYNKIIEKDYQLIWQTGKQKINLQNFGKKPQLLIKDFISDMALAYSAADIIVSRAGAMAISELALVQKPILLVPFPFAAENHQLRNALALVEKNAAKIVQDKDIETQFWNTLMSICEDDKLRTEMSANLALFAKPNATEEIVNNILNMIYKNEI